MDLSRLFQPYYTIRDQALPPASVTAIRDAILDAPYMSVNNLNRRFEGTYGFSVVFRKDTVDQVLAEFPAFAPYLEKALRAGDPSAAAEHYDLQANAIVRGPWRSADA